LQPAEHEFIRGDMPPGVAARFYQFGDPALRGQVQAVQLVAPADTTIEIGDAQSSFGQAQAEQMTVDMGIGYVYRFKLSSLPLPDAAGKTLYPSIEVIGKLNPPPGLESDFPIQVVVTREDIKMALAGRMITRVIYLEDPRGTLPHLHTVTDQPSIDVRRGQDPLRAAEQMGRPMAIFRMGSRLPMKGEIAEWFTFGVAAPTVLPNPRVVNHLGLSERELEIIAEMRLAEAAAKAKAGAVLAANAGKKKSTEKIRQADFSSNNPTQADLRIGANAETRGSSEMTIEPVVATLPIESEIPKAKKPKWIAVKANAKPQTPTQPKMQSMPLVRAFASPARQPQPPAPSMAYMNFEPIEEGLEEPTRVAPVVRRPNEL